MRLALGLGLLEGCATGGLLSQSRWNFHPILVSINVTKLDNDVRRREKYSYATPVYTALLDVDRLSPFLGHVVRYQDFNAFSLTPDALRHLEFYTLDILWGLVCAILLL